MRDYWAAWGYLLELTGVVLWVMLKRVLRPLAILLVVVGWLLALILLLAAGDYWQAAAVYVGSIAGVLLIGGHFLARDIARSEHPGSVNRE